MVDDVDVVVKVPAGRVGVGDHEVIGRVHPLRKLHAQVIDPLHVPPVVLVELVRREILRVRVQLVLPPVGPRQSLCAGDEGPRRLHRARHRCGTIGAGLDVLVAFVLIVAVQRVPDRVAGGPGRLHVDRTHSAVRSPSRARTASIDSMTSRSRSSSRAPPRRTAWFKLIPIRRTCSTA